MADILEPEPSYETAVEAVLGESLQYVLVQNQQAGVDAIAYLQASGAGRSGFVPDGDLKPAGPGAMEAVSIRSGSCFAMCRSRPALKKPPMLCWGMSPWRRTWRGHGRLPAERNFPGHRDQRGGYDLAAGDHDRREPGQAVRNFQKKSELKELKEKIDGLDVEIDVAAKRQAELESALRNAETVLQQLIEKKNRLQREEMEAEKALYKVTEELKHARHHLEVVGLEQEQLLGEKNDVDAEMNKFQVVLAQIDGKIKEKQREVVDAAEQIETVRMDVEEYRQRVVDLKIKLSALAATLDNRRSSLRRLKDFQTDAARATAAARRGSYPEGEKRVASAQKVEEYDRQLSGMYETIKALEKELESNEAEYSAISSQLKDKDTTISDIQSKREETLQKIRILEVEQSQKQMKRENIISRIEERYQRTFDELQQMHADASQDNTQNPESSKTPEQLEAELCRYKNPGGADRRRQLECHQGVRAAQRAAYVSDNPAGRSQSGH